MYTKSVLLGLVTIAASTVAADHSDNFHIGDTYDDWFGDGRLPTVVNDIPSCALPCVKERAARRNCQPTDFRCLCDHGVGIAAEVAICVPDSCSSICRTFDQAFDPFSPYPLTSPLAPCHGVDGMSLGCN